MKKAVKQIHLEVKELGRARQQYFELVQQGVEPVPNFDQKRKGALMITNAKGFDKIVVNENEAHAKFVDLLAKEIEKVGVGVGWLVGWLVG